MGEQIGISESEGETGIKEQKHHKKIERFGIRAEPPTAINVQEDKGLKLEMPVQYESADKNPEPGQPCVTNL